MFHTDIGNPQAALCHDLGMAVAALPFFLLRVDVVANLGCHVNYNPLKSKWLGTPVKALTEWII